MDLLRKKDLHEKVGVPKSTAADWIDEFHVFIPKVKQGNATYYKPECIDVLVFIKQCREQNYQKPQIMQMLSEKGFPITVEEAVNDVKKAIEGTNARDTLITVMQTMSEAVTKIAEQDEVLKTLGTKQDEQDGRLKQLEQQTKEIEVLKQELEVLRSEVAASKEKKGFFSKLFGR